MREFLETRKQYLNEQLKNTEVLLLNDAVHLDLEMPQGGVFIDQWNTRRKRVEQLRAEIFENWLALEQLK